MFSNQKVVREKNDKANKKQVRKRMSWAHILMDEYLNLTNKNTTETKGHHHLINKPMNP